MFQVVDLLFPLLDPPPVCPWYPRSHPCNQETAMATRKGVPVMQRWSNWQCETFQWLPTTNTLLSQVRPVDLNPKRYCNIPITPRLKCPQCVSVEIIRSQGTKYYSFVFEPIHQQLHCYHFLLVVGYVLDILLHIHWNYDLSVFSLEPAVRLAEEYDVFIPKAQLDSILLNYTRSGSLLFRKLVSFI